MAHKKSQLYLICKTLSTCKKLQLQLQSDWNVIILPTVNLQIKARFKGKSVLIGEEILHLLRLFLQPHLFVSGKNIACCSHHYSTLCFSKILSLLGVRHRVYLFNFYIHGLGEKRLVQKILQFLLNQNVALLTQSQTEINYFKGLCSTIDVRFFPYCSNEITDYNVPEENEKHYFFAGGYTNRDYELLIQCAEQLPREQFIIVCSHLNTLPTNIPDNVEIYKEIEKSEFHGLMAGSQAVVLPLKDDVGSSGQMVALAGMQMEKTVIYPDFDVVSQYFDDKVSGLMYQPGDQESMLNALRVVLEKPELLPVMGKRARQQWDSCYRRENFINAVCEHIQFFFTTPIH